MAHSHDHGHDHHGEGQTEGRLWINKMESIKASLKKLLQSKFDIHHPTLEIEFEPCEEHAETPCI